MDQITIRNQSFILCFLCMTFLSLFTSCAHSIAEREKEASLAENQKLVTHALTLFDPKNPQYNPHKAKFYLERALRKGQLTSLDLPAPVILSLLQSEKAANRKRKAIERRISSIKRIDLDKEEDAK